MKQFLRIGCIVRPHGIKGDVKLEPTTDRIERFRGLSDAFLEVDDEYRPVRINGIRLLTDSVVLHIHGIDSVESASELRGIFLCVDRAHAISLEQYTYFIADLIGLHALDTDNNRLGTITDVLEYPANDVYEIDSGKMMIPAIKRVISEVDVENGRIVFVSDVLHEVCLMEDSE